jgi:AcrR family transcriptional regulator
MKSVSASSRSLRRWQAADADARRAMIVDAAMRLLDRRGLGAVTIRAVAAKLGVGAMTLYTYVDGQAGLRRAMIQRGFEMLHSGCQADSTLESRGSWRGGARAYVHFAIEHPNLYQLMFTEPLPADDDVLHEAMRCGGFDVLLERVRQRLEAQGQSLGAAALRREALRQAGRYWIALHGLATLALSGRLKVLETDLDTLIDDLLERVAPD